MPICNAKCRTPLPQTYAPEVCNITPANGGIPYVVFKSCAFEFNNILDPAEWCTRVQSGDLVISGELKGKLDKGSATKTQYSSCRPEQVNSRDWSLAVMDYNFDPKNPALVQNFWDEIDRQQSSIELGFIGCDGVFFGFVDGISAEISPVIEETQTGVRYIDAIFMWKARYAPKPIPIPNLVKILQGNCYGIPNYNPCPAITVSYASTVLCTDEGILLTATYDNTANYQWYLNAVAIPGATSFMLYAQDAGDYTLTVTRPGCTDVTTSAITITSSRPTFGLVTVGGTSPNATVTINPVGTVTDFLYQVIAGDTPGAFLTSNVFTNLVSGTYTAVIKEISSGCTNSVMFTVP